MPCLLERHCGLRGELGSEMGGERGERRWLRST